MLRRCFDLASTTRNAANSNPFGFLCWWKGTRNQSRGCSIRFRCICRPRYPACDSMSFQLPRKTKRPPPRLLKTVDGKPWARPHDHEEVAADARTPKRPRQDELDNIEASPVSSSAGEEEVAHTSQDADDQTTLSQRGKKPRAGSSIRSTDYQHRSQADIPATTFANSSGAPIDFMDGAQNFRSGRRPMVKFGGNKNIHSRGKSPSKTAATKVVQRSSNIYGAK